LPAWRRANLALGVSKKSLHFLSSTDLAHRNFHIIYNGIDVDQTIRASKRGDTDIDFCWKDGLRFVLPASIGSPLKGHEVAIYALYAFLQQGNPAQLYICGDVPPGAPKGYYERLQQLVRELNLEKNVHFLGWRSDILAILGECDIVLLPSFTEGLPRSLLEAMALGKPVIATQVGGIPELIRNKIDGLLVPPGDVAALSDALHILSEPGLRGQMGRAAQKRVKEHFSLSTQAKNFLDAVEGVVGNL